MDDIDIDILPPPGPWRDHGACVGLPTEWFFSERGDSVIPGRAVCDGCVVRTPCLEYALDNRILWGIWGGTSERERRAMRRQRRADGVPVAVRPRPIAHGTPAGYALHRRRGEDPCRQCREAHNARNAEGRARRRAQRLGDVA